MSSTAKVLAINGSYRDNGITDQAVEAAKNILLDHGVEVETIDLRRQQIDFCLNCRACTQIEGTEPGTCVIDDAMHDRQVLRQKYRQRAEHVRNEIPSNRLLVYDVADGWEPLCRFLGVEQPDTEFPRTNNVQEFWDYYGNDDP